MDWFAQVELVFRFGEQDDSILARKRLVENDRKHGKNPQIFELIEIELAEFILDRISNSKTLFVEIINRVDVDSVIGSKIRFV